VRQSVPHAGRVLRNLRPTFRLSGLAELTPEFVDRHGVRGILWDVDGTLTHYHGRALAPEAVAAARLFVLPGLRHAVVSNSDDIRFAELGRMLPDVPVLKLYESEGRTYGRRLERGVETWRPEPPDRSALRAIRKPSAELIRFAVGELGLEAGQVVMVGDQHWTDIAGANLAGVRSIRVPTAGRSTFPWPLRMMQRIEDWMQRGGG
jgi:HAD superfamily phosphatase (TIGR01668 family)